MNHIRCEQFQTGGPAPSVYYAERLKTAFREICSLYRGRRKVRLVELEPLWHFVETMASARLFGANRRLYDQIDRQIDRMNRLVLIKLALKCFLTPGLDDYLSALQAGQVTPRDAAIFYLRIRATYDWMEDNIYIRDSRVADLDVLMHRFQQLVNRNHGIIVELASTMPDIRSFWRRVVSKADSRFLTVDYVSLIS